MNKTTTAPASPALLDDLISADEAAELLRVRKKWLYEACASQRIPHVRVGRFVRFSRGELETWLRGNHTEATR